MTIATDLPSNPEPTLLDISHKLDTLTTDVGTLTTRMDTLTIRVDTLTTNVDTLTKNMERFDDKFSNYQQATQWVVQLAFTLIASATLTIIITAIVRR